VTVKRKRRNDRNLCSYVTGRKRKRRNDRNLWTYVTEKEKEEKPKPDQKPKEEKPATLRGWELERCPRAPPKPRLAFA
jgi:hypothetical protein